MQKGLGLVVLTVFWACSCFNVRQQRSHFQMKLPFFVTWAACVLGAARPHIPAQHRKGRSAHALVHPVDVVVPSRQSRPAVGDHNSKANTAGPFQGLLARRSPGKSSTAIFKLRRSSRSRRIMRRSRFRALGLEGSGRASGLKLYLQGCKMISGLLALTMPGPQNRPAAASLGAFFTSGASFACKKESSLRNSCNPKTLNPKPLNPKP